jgi:hypothetical protein
LIDRSHTEDLALAERIQSCWEDALPNLESVFSRGHGEKLSEWVVKNFGVPASVREEDFLERQQLPLPLLQEILETLGNLPVEKLPTADEKVLQTHAESIFKGTSKPLWDGML